MAEPAAVRHLKAISPAPEGLAPATEKRTVDRTGKTNQTLRSREHLTDKEVGQLIKAARAWDRYGHRDATPILIAYRHRLRVSELCALRWDRVDLEDGFLHVRRVKRAPLPPIL